MYKQNNCTHSIVSNDRPLNKRAVDQDPLVASGMRCHVHDSGGVPCRRVWGDAQQGGRRSHAFHPHAGSRLPTQSQVWPSASHPRPFPPPSHSPPQVKLTSVAWSQTFSCAKLPLSANRRELAALHLLLQQACCELPLDAIACLGIASPTCPLSPCYCFLYAMDQCSHVLKT